MNLIKILRSAFVCQLFLLQGMLVYSNCIQADNSNTQTNLKPQYQIFYQLPVDKELKLKDVIKRPWTYSADGWISENFTQKNYWIGATPKVAWIKIELPPKLLESDERWIELASSGVSKATLFNQTSVKKWQGEQLDQLGYTDTRYINSRYLSFNVPLTSSPTTLYIRVEATNKFLLQLNIKTSKQFLNHNTLINFLYALGYGVLIAMALYNVTIGRSLGDPLYYVYTATILGAFMYQFFGHGHIRLFWPVDWDIVNYWLNWLAMFVTTLSLYFMYYFCNLKKYTPKIASRVMLLLKLLTVMTVVALFIPQNWSLNLALIVITPMPLIAVVISSYAWLQGSKTAKIFTIAWSFYILGSILWINYWLGLLPLNSWVEMPLLVGAALESILLSLALAYRIRLLSDKTVALSAKHQHYKRISQIDELTQLANRRAFDIVLKSLKRHNKKFGLMLLDIDFFKKFNDNYGHLAGDEVLVKFAKILQSAVRDDDLAVRVGGEEFAIVMPGVNADNFYLVAERVRRQFEELDFELKGDQVNCTVSIGLAISQKDESYQEMIERCDQALYKAKNEGRNQVKAA
jgi:two-component system, sensor histidine kinase LadS